MTRRRRRLAIAVAALGWLPTAAHALDPSVRVVAWNNLGMHCTDADFQVFSLLPPFNTVLAQVTRGGVLVTDPSGLRATYSGVADPSQVGSETFTFAANDGFTDSNLGVVQVAVPEPGAPARGLAALAALAAVASARSGAARSDLRRRICPPRTL